MAEAKMDHWAEDDELLHRFLTGEMGQEELIRCEDHVKACQACAGRLLEERTTIAGIRSFARRQMKSDLQSMLASRTQGRLTAWRWVGAAASIVLAVAVWYMPGAEEPVPTTDEIPVPPQMDAAAVPEQEADEEVSRRAARIETERRDVADAPGAGEESISVLTEAASGAARPSARDGGVTEDLRALKSAPASSREVQVWTLAVEVLPAPGFARMDKQEISMEAQGAESKKEATQDLQSRYRMDAVLSQRLYDRADRQMQMLSASTGRAIPVEVQDAGDSLRLVLYPPRLWDEMELRSAIVSEIGPDSLRILIGGQEFRMLRVGSQRSQD